MRTLMASLLAGAAMVACALTVAACSAGSAGDTASSADSQQQSGDVANGRTVAVPDVLSAVDGAEARTDLEAAGLAVAAESEQDSASFDPDRELDGCTVSDQDPIPGTEVDPDTTVTLIVDCRQVDWENQEGDDWDEFSSAFDDAAGSICSDFFDQTPTGTLHADGSDYTWLECDLEAPSDASDADYPQDVPDDPEADGAELAVTTTCEDFFDSVGSDLYSGNETFTVDDCESAADPVGTAAPKAAKSPAPSGGDIVKDCDWSGDTFAYDVSVRNISCRSAKAAFQSSTASSSGGFSVPGWTCSSPEVKAGGTTFRCVRGDQAFRFSASE